MILKLLICASILTFPLGHVAATSCFKLQQSQLAALNDRMNQMIQTISTLLPKSLKKLTTTIPSTPPAPAADYVQRYNAPERGYYLNPSTYQNPPPTPHIVYVPSNAPISTYIRPPRNSYPAPTPQPYLQTETVPQCPFSPIPPYAPQPPMFNYQYGQPLSQMPVAPATPSGYPPGTYSLIQPPPPPEYTYTYPLEYSLPAPTYPNIPSYAPGLPFFPLPGQIPPGCIATHPQIPLPQK